MALTLEEKHEMILAAERRKAYALARELIQKPEASVWMILIPILFIHHAFNIQRYKKSIHGFAENYIKTRQKALELAFYSMKEEKGIAINLENCFPSVEMHEEKEVRLCEKQLEEIRLFFHHYKLLMEARGKSYETMVRAAYGEAGRLKAFYNALEKAEKEVIRYVNRSFQTSEAALDVTKRMQKIVSGIRDKEVKEIF
ncbi:NF038143 family protein [Desulfobotulus alkaliphilus]|uniref:NF038143 family protein n=1 Tax=Desulfobotulus alkaliphilus TaxID=622671 RepID=UPI001C9778B5|nr:NF038143 family protein [Desulfobotulus alkaliphilus]